MAVKTLATLRAEAAQIANETGKRLNTALRVGNALLDIIDSTPSLGIDPRAAPYNAAGTGLVDDSAALLLAITAGIASGKPVCGVNAYLPPPTPLKSCCSSVTRIGITCLCGVICHQKS